MLPQRPERFVNCEDTMKFSFAYLDGEFDARDKIEFEAHLSMCGQCRESVGLDAQFRDTVRKHLVATPADPELKARVQARLSSARRQARLSRTLAVPMALAASIALAVVSYQGLVSKQPQQGALTVAAAVAEGGDFNDTSAQQVAAAARTNPAPAPTARPALAAAQPARVAQKAGASGNRAAVAPVMARSARARLVNTERAVASGALSGVRGHASPADWPVAEVRQPSSLRAMVQMHARPLPHEVEGDAAAVQSYLRARVRDVGAPPIGEGTGVHMLGARFSQIGGHPVVSYRYAAFGKPVTVLRFLQPAGAAPFDQPNAAETGNVEGTLDDHLAGYTVLHVLRNGVRYALVSELGLEPMKALLDLP